MLLLACQEARWRRDPRGLSAPRRASRAQVYSALGSNCICMDSIVSIYVDGHPVAPPTDDRDGRYAAQRFAFRIRP